MELTELDRGLVCRTLSLPRLGGRGRSEGGAGGAGVSEGARYSDVSLAPPVPPAGPCCSKGWATEERVLRGWAVDTDLASEVVQPRVVRRALDRGPAHLT